MDLSPQHYPLTMTPAQIKAESEPYFDGTITRLEVREGLDLWSVRAWIQPRDKRRRPVEVYGSGQGTRSSAIAAFLESAKDYWPEAHNLVPDEPEGSTP